MDREEEFLQMLRATFKVEAAEHLQAIADGLLALEKQPSADQQQRVIESVFRAAHSLKGAARAVNLNQVESICQSLEDMFASWKRGRSAPSPQTLDVAHRALDTVSTVIGTQVSTPAPAPASAPAAVPLAVSVPAAAAPANQSHAAAPPQAAAPDKAPPAADTVRISVAKLDARLLEAEEMLTAKLSAGQRALELTALAGQFDSWRKEWTRAQPQTRALRLAGGHAGLAEFLEWNHDYLRALESRVGALRRAAERDRLTIGRLVDDLMADSKKLLMLPAATICNLFPKLVRDLSRDQGKDIEFTLRGGEVQIDKRILEEMKDPLIHLLRNSIDHGIESPQQRRAAGKPARAAITLDVTGVDGNFVQILLADDGGGIDREKLKAVAIRRGVLTREAADRLTDSQALSLAFEAELSTSPIITELSGRGIGLAIVREKTEKLGGRVEVESRPGSGTAFRILLPLTLATFRGILVSVAQRTFVLPTAEVERVLRFRQAQIQTVEGRETLTHNGRAVSLVRLADVLELPPAPPPDTDSAMPAVILGAGEHRTAFAVDAVIDEQEVLVKQLAAPLVRVRNIGGATILGSGQVAPVLRVADLLKSARKAGAALQATAAPAKTTAPVKSVLVAEDSITSRLLLKGILESAGYRVKTAVDGLEAYTMLRTEHFDLVVSDVEMPRLNGFDLTARIRADRRLAQLPVILVTALDKREDRERGIEAGASAYLVKSSLDQSNLLEAIRRLI